MRFKIDDSNFVSDPLGAPSSAIILTNEPSGKLEVGCENGKFLQSCNQSYGDELNQLMTKLEAYMYSKEEAQMDLKNQLALVNQYAGFRSR